MQSTTEWKFWGRQDPMWSVATWNDRQVDGGRPWTIEEFREAGRSDCADIMRNWDEYGRNTSGTCIEIGCGSARLTHSLLNYFDRVLGIDVSPDQLALAKRVLGERLARVDLRLVDEPVLDAADATCAGMISTHVFQHLSSYSGIEAYLRETHRAIAAGASICFQIPVPGADKGEVPSWWRRAGSKAGATLARALGRRRFMEYNRYPARRIAVSLSDAGFDDVELRIIPLATTGFRQSFFFARKPA